MTGWWQLKYFFTFTPKSWGKIPTHFDFCMFLQGVETWNHPTIDDWEIISSLQKNGSKAIRQLGALGAEPCDCWKNMASTMPRKVLYFVWFSREHIYKIPGCSGATVPSFLQEVTNHFWICSSLINVCESKTSLHELFGSERCIFYIAAVFASRAFVGPLEDAWPSTRQGGFPRCLPSRVGALNFLGVGRWWLIGWSEWRGGGEVKRRMKKPPHQREAQLAKAACFWSYFWYDRYDPWGAKWFPNLSHISIELFIAKARKETTAGCFVCLLHIFGKLCCISLYLFGNSFLNCRGCIKTLPHRGDSFNPVQP